DVHFCPGAQPHDRNTSHIGGGVGGHLSGASMRPPSAPASKSRTDPEGPQALTTIAAATQTRRFPIGREGTIPANGSGPDPFRRPSSGVAVNAPPRPRIASSRRGPPPREKLEAVGAVPERASVGHRARGLLRRRDGVGVLPARARAQPRLSLG